MRIVLRLTPLVFSLSVLGLAQNAATDPVVKLDPLVIEGRLLTESPATVTTVMLDREPLSMATTAGLAARSANFFIATNDAHSFNDIFSLRGLTNTPIFGDPAISFYLDDLPLGSGFTFPVNLAGFAVAELHRGPTQNTVFGRAGSAGVVTLNTPEPSTNPQSEMRASYGNHNARQLSASSSTAASGATDAYVNVNYAARDGYITNTKLARDIDAKDSRSALVRVRARPSETSELTLLVTGLQARDGVQPLVPLGGPYFSVGRKTEGLTDVEAWNAALTAAFTTPVGRLTATTSRNAWDLGPYSNTLGFGFADLINNVTQQQRTWSEEVKLVSDGKSAAHWQIGAFYSDTGTTGSFARLFGPYPYEKSDYRMANHNLAAFGEMTFKLTPALKLTAGLRLEDSRKNFHRVETIPTPQIFAIARESSAWLPKLGLSYDTSRETQYFATVGAGYKPGGFSAFTGNRSLAAFGPERTKTFEAGVTHTSKDKSLAATVRVFYYDIDGYQIERSFATSSVADDYLVVNAPRARSLGGEIELSWKPLNGLTLAADLGVTHATLRKFTDPFKGDNLAGKRVPGVPENDLSLRAEYVGPGGFFVGAELNANGRTFYTENNSPKFSQASSTLLGAQFGYAHGRYRVTVYGQNLFDKEYYSAITPGTNHGTPGAPRTFGVEFSAKL
jgi:outer membrane receptor protein involved in Fe transport